MLSRRGHGRSWRPRKKAGYFHPHLCYLKDLNETAACRICVVEVEGLDKLVASCNTPVEEGMVVYTDSPRARRARPPPQSAAHSFGA